VDHFRVARTGFRADRTGAFENDDFAPGQRERARNRQADDAGPDDDAVNAFHGVAPTRRNEWMMRV